MSGESRRDAPRPPIAPPRATPFPQSCPLHSPSPTCKKDASGRGSRGQHRRTPFFMWSGHSCPLPLTVDFAFALDSAVALALVSS